jgi:hypothetical protein
MEIKHLSLRKEILALLIIWVGALGFGIWVVEKYKNTPGKGGLEQNRAPASIGLELDPARHTLVLFAHPLCSCSRASIAELEKLHSRHKGAFSSRIYFYVPAKNSEEWASSSLVALAQKIHGAKVIFDKEGRIAKQMGARTSGQAYLFSPSGNVEFMGGITGARGHEGENQGTHAISALLENTKTGPSRSKVFGCSLFKTTPALTSEPEEKP